MHTRRSMLALGASALVTSTAGCTDAIPFLGDEPMAFEADRATVSDSALEETGYEEHAIEAVEIERTVEAAGRTQDVVVTNWQAEYDKAIELGDVGVPVDERSRAAVCTALSTPQVDVLGETFNPVADMTSEELAEMVQDRYDGLGNLTRVGEETVTVLGQETTVGEFEGEADLVGAGQRIGLTLHVAESVESGEDLVVGVGGYPTDLGAVERPNVLRLLEAIEHEG